MKVWNIEGGTCVLTLQATAAVNDVAVTPEEGSSIQCNTAFAAVSAVCLGASVESRGGSARTECCVSSHSGPEIAERCELNGAAG